MRNELHVLVESLAGSRLYGTERVDSDYDYRGVCLAPIDTLIGLEPVFEQIEQKEPHDRTIWELRKFLRLAFANNPNILDTLFCPIEKWFFSDPVWHTIYAVRHDVLSQQVRKTYAGYATSQLQRIQGHRRWLTDPPMQPDVNDYGSYRGTSTWHWNSQDHHDAYKAIHKNWTSYQIWLSGRNPARHALEVEYGYDTKHAAHLIRPLVQARTILTTYDFSPVLEGADLEMVMAVLHGKWDYEQLIAESDRRFQEIATLNSNLPTRPHKKLFGDLVMSIYFKHINKEGYFDVD